MEFAVVTNNVVDRLRGVKDKRPGQVGTHAHKFHTVKYSPPAGHLFRVVKLRGDFIVTFQEPERYEAGYLGTLVSFHSRKPHGSRIAKPGSDDTLVYRQMFLSGPWENRLDFSLRPDNGILWNNELLVKQAVWNNTTGLQVQMETTWEVSLEAIPKPEVRRRPVT